MNDIEKNEIIEVFNILANIELSFAELYEACGKFWDTDAKLWLSIAQDERNHVECINKMSQIIAQSPEQFTQEKPFKPIALQTLEHTARTVIKKVNSAKIAREEILNIALDIEKSIIEAQYNDILKTEHSGYRLLAEKLVTESYEHKDMIQQRINEVNKVRRIIKD